MSSLNPNSQIVDYEWRVRLSGQRQRSPARTSPSIWKAARCLRSGGSCREKAREHRKFTGWKETRKHSAAPAADDSLVIGRIDSAEPAPQAQRQLANHPRIPAWWVFSM